MPAYHKLVRDKIPEIIERNGETCKVKRLDQSTYLQELKTKLKEEVHEYLQAENDESAVEELSDVLEIIHALSAIHGKGFRAVEAARKKKFTERGGFQEKVYLIEVDNDEHNFS